jgi:hypothetical protein
MPTGTAFCLSRIVMCVTGEANNCCSPAGRPT